MWPFKKKVEKAYIAKKYEYVKKEIKKLNLNVYEAKIYNGEGVVIGETSFVDNIILYGRDGTTCWGEELPISAGVGESEHHRFQNFLTCNYLLFEDYDGNEVTMATDIIKKIVISVFDEVEEEVQLYSYVEVKK